MFKHYDIHVFVFSDYPCSRRCRYLALVAALTSEADYVFIPESPPPEDWQKRLCDKLEQVF